MSKYNILIVEDELIPANYLKKTLEQYGHNVVGIVNSKKAAMEYTYKKIPLDLVLMDIKIKGEKDGIDTAKALQSYLSVAILFISAYSDKDYLERAKDINSIGYLVKPIQTSTLLSTIEIGMSHFSMDIANDNITLCDGIVFDTGQQVLKKEHEIIDLSHHETIVLKTLLGHKNTLTTQEELEDAFYQLEALGEGALRTTIWRLRKKLPHCVSIETVYKSGYKIKL
jgi:DNA-binding response OmpR family regulator